MTKGGRTLVLTLLCAVGSLSVPEGARGDKVPRYDVGAICRGAPSLGTDSRDTDRDCIRDEERAHTQLRQLWSGFDTQRRSLCVQETRIGGPPSYVALLSCLQM